MKFDIGPRNAEFGTFNNRSENHGDEKVKAIDLPVKIAVTLKELDGIVPLQSGKFSETIYSDKKNLQTYVLSPLYVNRKPENVMVTVWDSETDEKKQLAIEGCSIKSPVLEFEDKGVVYLSFKIQISKISIKDLERIIENVENKVRKLRLRATAPELPLDGEDAADGENDKNEGESD